MNQPLMVSLITIVFAWGCPQLSWAETVLEKVQRTGVLTAGVRQDAVSFSYIDANNELEGYAVDLYD